MAAGAVLAALAGVLWAVGGFRPAPEAPQVAPGQWVDGERFRVKAVNARVMTRKPGGAALGLEPTDRYLVVDAEVENVSMRPATLTDLILWGVTVDARPGGRLPRTGTDAYRADQRHEVTVQPGLPEHVYLMWPLTAEQPTPREITVRINDFVYRPNFFDERESWNPDRDDMLALVTLPVRGAGNG